ncbi:hypothetical protein GQ457_05G020430 [Hibiscus cannabinus]
MYCVLEKRGKRRIGESSQIRPEEESRFRCKACLESELFVSGWITIQGYDPIFGDVEGTFGLVIWRCGGYKPGLRPIQFSGDSWLGLDT